LVPERKEFPTAKEGDFGRATKEKNPACGEEKTGVREKRRYGFPTKHET